MKTWLTVILAWIVSLFTFWKLGQRDGKQTLQIDKSKEKEETIARAISTANRVIYDYRMRHKN